MVEDGIGDSGRWVGRMKEPTFDPNCQTCGGTLHPCECHLLVDSEFTDLHPPHGKPWFEWKGICPRCHEHQWTYKPTSIPKMKFCEICKFHRIVEEDAGLID